MESEIEIDYLPSFTFPGADINVLRILPIPVDEAYLIYWFIHFFHSYILWGVHRDKFHLNAENNIIHTLYEKLRSGSVLKIS